MSAFQQKYKEKVIGFGNTKESRFIRAKEREESRKRQRAENFNNCRNIPTSSRTENKKMQSNHMVKDDSTRFMKWKAEQERRRVEQMKKKQPFVVGIVHHKIYSPIPSYRNTNSNITNKVCNKAVSMSSASLPKRITKATEKRLMNKGLTKEAIDQSSKNQKSLNNGQKKQEKQELSFAPTDYKFESRTKLSRIPLFVGIGIKRISYTKINKSALSPIKISETSNISNTTECTVENLNHKHNNTAVIDKQKDTDDLSENFIEPMLLKPLCGKKGFTSYHEINNNNNDDSELKVQDNNICNSSSTKILCSSKYNMFTLSSNDPQDEVIFSPYVVLSCKKTSTKKEQQSECVFSVSCLKDGSKKCTSVKQDKTQLNLQEIQISAALKSTENLSVAQKVGQICKTSDVLLDNEIFSINSNQTPRKCILKQPNNLTKIESCIKSTIQVKVDQNIISNEVLVNQEILLKPNSFTSPEIDGYNAYSPDKVAINIKRRLSFNSEEFDDGNLQNSKLRNSINRKGTEVPSINIHTATPLKHSNLDKSTNTPFSKTCLTGECAVDESTKELDEDLILNITSTQLKEIAENTDSNILKQEPHKCIYINNKEEPSEYNENIKVLRNKNIIVVDTPTPRRLVKKVNIQELKQKENKTPSVKTRKKSFVKVAVDQGKTENSKDANCDKRKYRRGVKSSEKDYCGYVSNKSATPTTPHIR